jgi:hypothetical protein
MNPNANLKRQLELAGAIIHATNRGGEPVAHEARELAEELLALHAWRMKGGLDPYVARQEVDEDGYTRDRAIATIVAKRGEGVNRAFAQVWAEMALDALRQNGWTILAPVQ